MTYLDCVVVTPNHGDELLAIRVSSQPVGTQVCYVRLPSVFEIEYLDFELDRILGSRTDDAEVVIIRAHSGVRDALLMSSTVREKVALRFPYAQIYLLHWSTGGGHECLEWADGTKAEGVDAYTELARDIDFQLGLEQPGALLPANPEFHYDGPNGHHYESYVRAGYAFQSVDAIEGAAFWMLPHARDVDLLVLDSWTMLGLGHSMSTYFVREGGATAPLAIECGEEYGETDHLRSRLMARSQESTTSVKTMLLTSVHSTGRTEQRLQEQCDGAGLEVVRVVRLYSSEPWSETTAALTLHHMALPVKSSPPGQCKSCLVDRKSSVPVDRKSLLLALTAAVEETRITKSSADDARGFLEAYAGTRAVTVHRTDSFSNRHHMIYIDIMPMLRSTTFKVKLARLVESLTFEVDVVVTPEHPAAIALGLEVAKILGVHHVAAEQKRFGELTGEDRAALFAAESILFVDDVMITGGRLRRVKSELMRNRVITDKKDVAVGVLIGVARPESAGTWIGLTDMVGGKDRLLFVEYLELPNWASDECTWCWELSKLTDYSSTRPVDGYLEARLQRLRDVEAGLHDDIFLASSEGAGGQARSLPHDSLAKAAFGTATVSLAATYRITREYAFSELGQGSIFGRLKEVELFAGVAASLQRLRNEHKLSDRPQYPLSRVLDPYLYFLGRFYANIIVACILRAARRRDIRTVDIEAVLRQATGVRLGETESRELHAELLLAITQTKLPIPQETSDPEVFDLMNFSVADFLRWLVLEAQEQ